MPGSDNEQNPPTNEQIAAAWTRKNETHAGGAMVVLRLTGVLSSKGVWGRAVLPGQIATRQPEANQVRQFCVHPECIAYAFAVFDDTALANHLGQFFQRRGYGGNATYLEVLGMHPFLHMIREYCIENPHPTEQDLVKLSNTVGPVPGQPGIVNPPRKPKNRQPPHSSDQLPWHKAPPRSNQQDAAESYKFWPTNQWWSPIATGPSASHWHQAQQVFGWPQPHHWPPGASLQPWPPQQTFYNYSAYGSLARPPPPPPPQLEPNGLHHGRHNIHERQHSKDEASKGAQTSVSEPKTALKGPSGLTAGSLDPQTSRINQGHRNVRKRHHAKGVVSGTPETAQKSPGDTRQAQKSTGEPLRAQESPKLRRTKSVPAIIGKATYEEVDEALIGKATHNRQGHTGEPNPLLQSGTPPWRSDHSAYFKRYYFDRYAYQKNQCKRARTNQGIHV